MARAIPGGLDDFAAMILLCCNPDLSEKAQLCLMLKAGCGLSVHASRMHRSPTAERRNNRFLQRGRAIGSAEAGDATRCGISGDVTLKRIRAWAVEREGYLWTGLLAGILLIQFPVLKGWYYRAAGTPAPPSSIAWRTDLNQALEEARRTDKHVLVDFTADWCPPCIAMKHDVWPNPAVERAVAASFVPVLIDVDRDIVVSERYGVASIPTVLVLDSDGAEVRRSAFRTARRMVPFLDTVNE